MAEQNLVSVEIQNEHSVTTGQRETRIFVKMYVDAVHSGLIADMGADNWQTLCVIAAFMNEKGECYPTQDLVATRLGIARETANRRIQKLLRYRWKDKPLIAVNKIKSPSGKEWMKNTYTVYPISCFSIFSDEKITT
jgi:hypothetical protein